MPSSFNLDIKRTICMGHKSYSLYLICVTHIVISVSKPVCKILAISVTFHETDFTIIEI